ncbi:MAG: cadherin-like beta sandwich domain-containing protein [Fibrobacteres bacterium]|jgi:hypothetical protein|nr:cadherin-like beta sandwich domain-containing protein [Fibrobacterota bacterium]
MKARLSAYAWYALLLAAALAYAGCQTVDPPPAQNLLYLQLDDSLKRYDLVQVDVFDRDKPDKFLTTLWNNRLLAPASDIPAYDINALGTNRFIIRVMGIKANQIALQTRIFYAPPPDRPSVLHDSVGPLVPQNWLKSLTPSVGAMTPDFEKDSLNYQVKMPEKMDSLNFILVTAYQGASIDFNGSPAISGQATKFVKIGNTPETIIAHVTDTSTGTPSTREYRIVVFPTLPQGVSLLSLVPSTGRLGTEFTPQQTFYNLYMDPDKDTVSFLATASQGTTLVTIDGLAVFQGQQSQVITVAKGTTDTIPITVHRGSDVGYYQVTLDHTQGSHH